MTKRRVDEIASAQTRCHLVMSLHRHLVNRKSPFRNEKPSGKYFGLCAAGRLLILSAFPSTAGKVELSREACLAMNEWCETIAKAVS